MVYRIGEMVVGFVLLLLIGLPIAAWQVYRDDTRYLRGPGPYERLMRRLRPKPKPSDADVTAQRVREAMEISRRINGR